MDVRVCVVGAGPVGLEMAVRAVRQGFNVCLIERGPLIAANVREWQHVELFSPWSLNMSAAGKEVLAAHYAVVADPCPFRPDLVVASDTGQTTGAQGDGRSDAGRCSLSDGSAAH